MVAIASPSNLFHMFIPQTAKIKNLFLCYRTFFPQEDSIFNHCIAFYWFIAQKWLFQILLYVRKSVSAQLCLTLTQMCVYDGYFTHFSQ